MYGSRDNVAQDKTKNKITPRELSAIIIIILIILIIIIIQSIHNNTGGQYYVRLFSKSFFHHAVTLVFDNTNNGRTGGLSLITFPSISSEKLLSGLHT